MANMCQVATVAVDHVTTRLRILSGALATPAFLYRTRRMGLRSPRAKRLGHVLSSEKLLQKDARTEDELLCQCFFYFDSDAAGTRHVQALVKDFGELSGSSLGALGGSLGAL